MSTWENIGDINCGNVDVTQALRPGVSGYGRDRLRTKVAEMSTRATHSLKNAQTLPDI